MAQLTTREWEVLRLLRRGYSNRDIAQELGISLAGAKYHVSEIISKLGVSSREEAAAWPERSQHWGFVAPLLGMFPSWAKWVHPSKVAVSVGLAFVALSGAGVGGFLLLAGVLGSKGPPSTTDFDPCAGIPGCPPISERRYTTIEEAATHASFVPMLPGSLPDGFEPHVVLATDRDLSTSYAANLQAVHNDWITVVYRNAAGQELLISQGFPARPEALWFAGLDGAEVGTIAGQRPRGLLGSQSL